MGKNRVFVEVRKANEPDIIRIFKTPGLAASSQAYAEGRVIEYPRKDAVEIIRRKVFRRANNECERCGRRVTWVGMHMDEKISRGEGGEISMDNCWALCFACHEGRKDSEHGNRRLIFGEST